MITVGRLNFWKGTEEKSKEIMQNVGKELRQRKLKIHNCDRGWIEEWHFGNYCLPGVPIDIAEEMANKYDLEIDLVRNIIDESDFDNIKINDKVTVEIESFFGGMHKGKGTVINKNENEIVVRKYKCQNKGWRIRIGDIGNVVVGW